MIMDKEASILTLSFDLDYESDANVSSSEAINATRAFERVIRVVVPVLFTLIAVIGFTGNLLVIVVVAINRQMRSTTNLLIICLATADLTFIVICVPFTAISYAIPIWPFGQTWCQIYQNVIHITAYVSVYTLVLMSFDRYLAVVHPISSMTLRTWSKTCVVVSVFYSIICILESLAMMDFGVVEYVFYGEFRSSCLYIRSDNGRRFYGCFFAFAYVVPLGLVCLLYGLMIRKLLSRMPRPGEGRGGSTSRSLAAKTRSNRRVTLMVVVVVVVFAVCWFPIQIILILQTMQLFQENAIAFVSVKIASNCLAYLNSCVNPFLYAFLSESFRKGFRSVLQCGDVTCCCSCCDSDLSVSLRPETMGLIEPKRTHSNTHTHIQTHTHTQTHSRRIESGDLKESSKTRTSGDIDLTR